MGNRVAELKTPGCGDVEGYAVYQSTSMAMFTPIFRNQLAAELFASALYSRRGNWSESAISMLAVSVETFMIVEFSDPPQDDPNYDDYLADPEKQDELCRRFLDTLPALKPGEGVRK